MNIIIYGANGRMGKAVAELAAMRGINIACGIDKQDGLHSFPLYKSLADFNGSADVCIDFSNPSSLEDILSYAVKTKTALVLATTGYSENDEAAIQRAAKAVPILKSANMSVGVNLLLSLVKQAAAALPGFDIEIVEKHHNQKADSPSGTALMLANAANLNGAEIIYGRHGMVGKRGKEIAVHAVRGGTIVGEHDVIFAGQDEIVTLSHTALSRSILASGALTAATFILNKPPALYSMADAVKV